jgi:deazaflavin-dependent oxidoreductase (nitroreductase family)
VAYLRPHQFMKKVFNPLAMRFGLSGTAPMEVKGRRTGRPARVPVIPVELGGDRYVVSTRGEADWVRNLRAAGEGRLGAQRVTATEVPAGERAPIIEAYRAKAGRATAGYFTKLPNPADHPVFRLQPRE